MTIQKNKSIKVIIKKMIYYLMSDYLEKALLLQTQEDIDYLQKVISEKGADWESLKIYTEYRVGDATVGLGFYNALLNDELYIDDKEDMQSFIKIITLTNFYSFRDIRNVHCDKDIFKRSAFSPIAEWLCYKKIKTKSQFNPMLIESIINMPLERHNPCTLAYLSHYVDGPRLLLDEDYFPFCTPVHRLKLPSLLTPQSRSQIKISSEEVTILI